MIFQKPLFPFVFILIVCVAVLHMIAVKFFLYWRLFWFDIPMHFLGGLWIGLAVLWFVFLSGYMRDGKETSRATFLLIGVLSALCVGLAWERFEFVTGITFIADHYVFDTVQDVVMDCIGGIVAGLYLFRYYKGNKRLVS